MVLAIAVLLWPLIRKAIVRRTGLAVDEEDLQKSLGEE
jgi:hypothetical protein